MRLPASVTCNIVKGFTVQCREEHDSGTSVAENFVLMCPEYIKDAGDDLSSTIFSLSDCAENVFTV